jgi:long-chain acyl-CoA synthetase
VFVDNLLHETIARHGDLPFLIDGLADRVFTYREAHGLACRVAAELAARGVGGGDRVAIVLTNSAEFALLYFGCLYLGATAVPVNTQLHPDEIEFIPNHSDAKLVIASPGTRHLARGAEPAARWTWLPAAEGSTPADGDAFVLPPPHPAEPVRWEPRPTADALFSITFTSGTTSRPKGVCHRVGALLANAAAFNAELGFGPGNRFLHVFNMAYMAGFLNTLLSPFLAGASVVLSRAFDAQTLLTFWQPVLRHRADTFWLAPSMLAGLLRLDRDPAGAEYCRRHVKAICVGTAPLPLQTKREFEQKYGATLYESYGLSELLYVTTNSPWLPQHDGSVGRPLPGVVIRVANERSEEVPAGAEGEVWVQTAYRMVGYLDGEGTGPDSSCATGDVGRLDGEGNLYITGRKKDLIIRGGINISPRAVEDVLHEHAAVAQAAVIGLPHEFYGEEVVAVVTLKPGHTLTAERASLVAHCKQRLSPPCVPGQYVELGHLPVNANGKVQKSRLREHLLNGSRS